MFYLRLRYLLLISLHQDSLGLDLLNKLLSSLSQHSRLIHCANQIDILSIEALSQMNHRSFKAVLSKQQHSRIK